MKKVFSFLIAAAIGSSILLANPDNHHRHYRHYHHHHHHHDGPVVVVRVP